MAEFSEKMDKKAILLRDMEASNHFIFWKSKLQEVWMHLDH